MASAGLVQMNGFGTGGSWSMHLQKIAAPERRPPVARWRSTWR